MTDAYAALATEYKKLARTPEISARFDIEMSMALGDMTHHHM